MEKISTALRKATLHDEYLPSWLLKTYLENDRLQPDHTLKIIELIAGELNRNPRLPRIFFITEIHKISRRRRAELHMPECWADLEFCKALQSLSAMRRAKALKMDEA